MIMGALVTLVGTPRTLNLQVIYGNLDLLASASEWFTFSTSQVLFCFFGVPGLWRHLGAGLVAVFLLCIIVDFMLWKRAKGVTIFTNHQLASFFSWGELCLTVILLSVSLSIGQKKLKVSENCHFAQFWLIGPAWLPHPSLHRPSPNLPLSYSGLCAYLIHLCSLLVYLKTPIVIWVTTHSNHWIVCFLFCSFYNGFWARQQSNFPIWHQYNLI